MTLAETVLFAVDIFEKAHPDEGERCQILVDFLEQEMGLSTDRVLEVLKGKSFVVTTINLREDWITRFGLWLYINHLSSRKVQQIDG